MKSRLLGDDHDWKLVRDLLVETYSITPLDFNWDVRRWDGWRWYQNDDSWREEKHGLARIWLKSNRVVAAVHREGSRDAHLQIHPEHLSLEEEMIAWAEKTLPGRNLVGQMELLIFVYEDDQHRCDLLASRDFERLSVGGYHRRASLEEMEIPESNLLDGYQLKDTTDYRWQDGQKLANLLNTAFRREIHNAEEYEIFRGKAPSFRADLDLLALVPDGTWVSYVGLPYDSTNKRGVFEPVCTHPDHGGKGIAKALMLEGLRRLKALGAEEVSVGTGDQVAANRLYRSLGFTEERRGFYWRKRL